MFRSGSVYDGGGSVSRAAWYAPRGEVRFDKTGQARWHTDPFARRSRIAAWFARLFRHHGAPNDLPTAIIAASSGLPAPSIVYVTNLQTYTTVRMRVEERAPLGAALISLSPQAAAPLGVQPGQPLAVRVRYDAPMVTYREPGPARYAFWRSSPRPVLQAAIPPAAPRPVAAPAVPAVPANAVVAQAASRPPAGQLQLQVGAFADEANARRAMVRLAAEGPGIEPLPASGSTLYRVVLRAPADAQAAEALRLRVAKNGFPNARFVRLP